MGVLRPASVGTVGAAVGFQPPAFGSGCRCEDCPIEAEGCDDRRAEAGFSRWSRRNASCGRRGTSASLTAVILDVGSALNSHGESFRKTRASAELGTAATDDSILPETCHRRSRTWKGDVEAEKATLKWYGDVEEVPTACASSHSTIVLIG